MNKISFLILTHGEPQALDLLDYLNRNKKPQDEIIVLNDPTTAEYETELRNRGAVVVNRKLDYSYSEHRNAALPFCIGNWVFALDADERPAKFLLDHLHEITEKVDADIIWLPRLNIVTNGNAYSLVLWEETGDYQCRLFKNGIGLKWHGNLHERLTYTEATKQRFMAKDATLAIVHNKTWEQLNNTNLLYRNKYTAEENKGIK